MALRTLWKFPKANVLRTKYTQIMRSRGEPHLGEKTAPTINQWLGGKTVVSFDRVPHYAQYDYEELCKDSKPAYMMAKMNAVRNVELIKDVLESIAERQE